MAVMREQAEFMLVKWPFLLGNALLLSMACLIYRQSTAPMAFWQVGLAVLCVAAGAGLSITPFLLEYRVVARSAPARELASALDQVSKLEGLIAKIATAAGQGQGVNEGVARTASAAKGLAKQISAEVQNSAGLMKATNDSEKSNLPLDVEQRRRLEDDCLQALVRVLDHVYALHVGALSSGQANLIQQVSNFQDACREAARRTGLIPFIAEPAEPFDTQRHQAVDGEGAVPEQATIADTVATGYTFKGRLMRPALVRLLKSGGATNVEGQTEDKQTQVGGKE